MEIFTYTQKAQTIYYKGQVLDSLLELKYILMMEETHAWLREGLGIYYNIDHLTSGMKSWLHVYSPDFLVRDWASGKAELIEIKPEEFDDYESLRQRRKISRHFLNRFGYDWTFKVIYESDIILSQTQWIKYRHVLQMQYDWLHKPCQYLLQNHSVLTDSEYTCFVRSGRLPATNP